VCSSDLAIGFVVLIVWWNGRRLRARAKELTEEVQKATKVIRKQKEEVEKQKEEVEKQKEVIEEAHQDITASIRYAKRIQDAILPSREALNKALGDSFLYYLPKDVVAGDFYWQELLDGKVYFAAADCTGHGVPGAMVSVVCSNSLTKSLLEEGHTDTGKLLDRTRELVVERFAKSGEEVKDGMDISLCALNRQTLELQWSGANNPLYIVRKGIVSERLVEGVPFKDSENGIEIKPDKQPIGYENHREPEPFTTHKLTLKKGDMLYIFSDGVQDQFGGKRGKKFGPKRLRNLLESVYEKSVAEQEKLVEQAIEDWQGELEQVDDIVLIGLRV
jgi:serine phosphatase RsbU (regulator of sigma subunit)